MKAYKEASFVKPIVHYVPTGDDNIVEGTWATLFHVVDHPNTSRVSNKPGQCVWTSKVVKIHENGFETLNTRYVPMENR